MVVEDRLLLSVLLTRNAVAATPTPIAKAVAIPEEYETRLTGLKDLKRAWLRDDALAG